MAEGERQMNKAIGGYFEKEPRTVEEHAIPQKNGILLNTARNAFEHILRMLPDVTGVYLPYYTCDVMLQPLKRLKDVAFAHYHLNHKLEIADEIELEKGQYIVVNNYYGIKDAYVQQMVERYGDRLIVDNAQAFYAPVLQGVKALYSPRKFFGVPDGGIACVPNDNKSWLLYDTDDSDDRLEHLRIRIEQGPEAGYKKFREAEDGLDNQETMLMSYYTREALQHIDYEKACEIRRRNFQMLHEALYNYNVLPIPDMDSFACPMAYPFVDCRHRDWRYKMKEQRIFIPKFWPNVVSYGYFDYEEMLAERIMPLPIDQRYGEEDMKRIIDVILKDN